MEGLRQCYINCLGYRQTKGTLSLSRRCRSDGWAVVGKDK